MATAAADHADVTAFKPSRDRFEQVCAFLTDQEAAGLTHGELEQRLTVDLRELVRQLFQDHLDLRAAREPRRDDVVDVEGNRRGSVETGHLRPLQTIFGTVEVTRCAYRRRGQRNLYPADACLNLPVELHSHGLRELSAIEASRGSFQDARDAVGRVTGIGLGKRQLEQLAVRAAVDFDAFYDRPARTHAEATDGDLLVLSADGKGIVMRPDALRPATAKAAAKATGKLKTRLSKGEKRNRKRVAEIGAVYDLTPLPRTPRDIIGRDPEAERPVSPKARNKWLTASVVDNAATVISSIFDEAQRRDPTHQRTWVALVDGARHQIDCIQAEATARKIKISIVCDFIHVLEYIWTAAWSFFPEADPDAETWVAEKAHAVLSGQASTVAAAIRRKATRRNLDPQTRRNADRCADYLLAKKDYLNYPTALAAGWPIATGIIEGACRHLVKDRLDLTGARWGLQGAQAILKLRALRSNADWDSYWTFHLKHERHRTHDTRYNADTTAA
ncbi:ISKra4 family transposase [Intrasporangium sp.]|uniref:ISKra4 family transposase n=1 Tax=Intrasporangium sp. TaxID=1925024 RepID=UPI003221829A